MTFEFSLNFFLNSMSKIFAITSKGFKHAISRVRDQDAKYKQDTFERQDL